MGINTQKFLMLFLVIPEQKKLTLDFAAKVIHGENNYFQIFMLVSDLLNMNIRLKFRVVGIKLKMYIHCTKSDSNL